LEFGNNIGTFLEVDEQFKIDTSHLVAYILVELALKDGLVEDIEIEVGSQNHVQMLD
jgi:hypothetical protein